MVHQLRALVTFEEDLGLVHNTNIMVMVPEKSISSSGLQRKFMHVMLYTKIK